MTHDAPSRRITKTIDDQLPKSHIGFSLQTTRVPQADRIKLEGAPYSFALPSKMTLSSGCKVDVQHTKHSDWALEAHSPVRYDCQLHFSNALCKYMRMVSASKFLGRFQHRFPHCVPCSSCFFCWLVPLSWAFSCPIFHDIPTTGFVLPMVPWFCQRPPFLAKKNMMHLAAAGHLPMTSQHARYLPLFLTRCVTEVQQQLHCTRLRALHDKMLRRMIFVPWRPIEDEE